MTLKLTKQGRALVEHDIPIGPTDSDSHGWVWSVAKVPLLSFTATGDGAGGIMTGDMTIGTALTVQHTATFEEGMEVTGDANFYGGCIFFGTVSTNDDFSCGGDVSCFNNLDVSKRIRGSTVGATAAGSLVLGAGNYNFITGTTTINYILTTNWTSGSTVILEFDGNVTITNNAGSVPADHAAIKLNGAANFNATASDTLQLTYNGTYWVETGGRNIIT